MTKLLSILLLFIGISISVVIEAAPDSLWIKVELKTDGSASENSWTLKKNNGALLGSSGALSNYTLHLDSFWVAKDSCHQFNIIDLSANGIAQPGYLRIYVDGNLQADISDFDEAADLDINCQVGESCLTPIALLGEGLFYAQFERTWFSFVPDSTGIFSFSNCGKAGCNTKIWLYENCPTKLFSGAEGALAYNDDKCLQEAEVNTYLYKDSLYYVRLEDVKNSCSGGIFLTIIAERTLYGCLDTTACNYDPLANTSNGNCIYYPNINCHPDLQVNQVELDNTIVLDKVIVDSLDFCLMEEGCVTGFGERDVIKFSTLIENIGGTDFYLGNPRDNPDQFNNTNCHGHYHYEGYADYFLIDNLGYRIPIGFKNGFCLMDTECDTLLPKFNCQTQGISNRCNDLYDFNTECQWIDITDIKNGVYTLVNRINANKNKDAFGRFEVEFDNNWAQACIEISRPNGIVAMSVLPNCDDFYDCAGVKFGNASVDCNGDCGGDAIFGDILKDGEVNSNDVNYLHDLLLNENSFAFPCYDLNANQHLDIADAFLLDKCATHQDSIVHTHNHPECVFPKRSDTLNQQIEFSIMSFSSDPNYIDIGLNTNGNNVSSLQLDLTGIHILSAELQGISGELKYDRNSVLALFSDEANYSTETSFLRIYFSGKTGIDTLRINNAESINETGNFLISNPGVSYYVLSTKDFTHHLDLSSAVRFFPNPASDKLTIIVSPKLGFVDVEICDLNGKIQLKLDSKSEEIFDISVLKSGSYFIRFSGEFGIENRLLIVD